MANETNNQAAPRRRLMTRRNFLRMGGITLGATVVGVYLGRTPIRRSVHQTLAHSEGSAMLINNVTDPFVLFELQEDNRLVINAPFAEMGQGIFTGFAMLVAEEFDMRMDQIDVRLNAPGKLNDNGATGGSGTTRTVYTPFREIAATMREALKNAAAQQWSVDPSTVQTKDGILSAGGQELRYVDVVNATTEWDIPEDPPELRPRSSFKIIGTEQKRVDLAPKVMGEAIFAIDQEVPNMVHANLLKCPYIEGTLKSMDVAAAKAVPGVIDVVQTMNGDNDLIAVVAENRYAAEMGKRALNAVWNMPKVWQQSDIDALTTVGAEGLTPVNLQRDGRAKRVLDEAGGTVISAEYRVATGVHAHMEPNSAIADVQGDTAFLYVGNQGAGLLTGAVASALGIPSENVKIQNSYLGGAFGRRVAFDPGVDAAIISQAVGRPVQVVWDRETEFQCGLFRPPTHHAFRAKVDESGKVVAMEHELASGSQIIDILSSMIPFGEALHGFLGADLMSASHGSTILYDFENRETNMYHVDLPFNLGIWRGVGVYPNGFAIEAFIDEVAYESGQDPFDLRLAHLDDSKRQDRRYRQVLTRLREESGWDTPKPEGVGRGLAMVDDRQTVCAAVIEASVVDGEIRVLKVTHVTDPGIVVNPDGVRQQVEGCIMMGISASLFEETVVVDNQFSASNYHQYPMALVRNAPPEVNVILMENADLISGIGEPPIGPIGPAISNAIFDATGIRLRETPMQQAYSRLVA